MDDLLSRLPPGSRVAVIRLRSLGDCALTTPALSLLESFRPDLEIGVVVDRPFAAVFEGWRILEPNAAAVARFRPSLSINLHGGTRSMWLTAASRARMRAGFAHHRYSFVYSTRIPRAQEILRVDRKVHTAEHLASAMFYLGVPQTEIPRAKLIAAPSPIPAPYAVIHPFASASGKTWPAGKFIEISQRLRESGLDPIILAGPTDEPAQFHHYQTWRNEPIERVKSLLAGAQLFVGNDSGPAHIAAAFGIPIVMLFGESDPVIWAPWRTESQVLTAPYGIGAISTDRVWSAIESLKVKA